MSLDLILSDDLLVLLLPLDETLDDDYQQILSISYGSWN